MLTLLRNPFMNVAVAATLALGAACELPEDFDTEPGQPKDEGAGGKAEAWNTTSDNPRTFAPDLQYRFDSLPSSGETETPPWAGNYWPTYQDNINHRWDGPSSVSPAAKFGLAFGISGVEDAVSQHHGIDSMSTAKSCTQNSQCDASLGEACAKRTGASSGRCIPTWFGICHAWAPAALMYKEPERAVDYGGQHFKIQDIKALLSLANNDVDSEFVSLRCDLQPGDIRVDAYGRPTNRSCRYTNPGTYHVLLANFLGLRKQGFVEDRTQSAEVWNQPIRSFEVLEQREVTEQEANSLLGVITDGGTVTESDSVAKDAWKHYGPFPIAAGDSLFVGMTGTGDADLYVRFNARPTAASGGYDCRPYADNSAESCNLTAPATATSYYVSVNGYAATSSFEVQMRSGSSPTQYQFNASAERLVYVKTKVGWISESPAGTDGNLASTIDRYTKYDTYEYILEINAAGDIFGGEWVGASKLSHPDFLWLPTGLSATSVAGGKIKWSDVKTIYDLSISDDPTPPATGATWHGNGSLISFTSGTMTGYGLDKDMSRAHPGAGKPVVFFQWEIDQRDGTRLRIEGPGTATITYGTWSDRNSDRVYENVTLPFVLDPARDGKTVADGSYYVVAVAFSQAPGSAADVVATATTAAATSATSRAAQPITVDGHTWNGTGSIIGKTSGTQTGYGLDKDVANIHPTSANNPVVFFQWEIDGSDGRTLELSAPGMTSATITYGSWDSRGADITRTVTLPYTLNPAADGKATADGTYYVIKVAFDRKPAAATSVQALVK